LTSAEVEAKFAWGQKKKNKQVRLTFVSNYLVNTVQRIGGQTTSHKIMNYKTSYSIKSINTNEKG
jgi:hypothetical protein